MSTDSLTQKNLEQHDKFYTKLQSIQEMTVSQSKENANTIKSKPQLQTHRESSKPQLQTRRESNKPQLQTRRESNKLVPTLTTDQTSSHIERKISKSFERKTSKPFLIGPHQTNGISVFRMVQAARTWKRFSQRNQSLPEKPKVPLENTYKTGPDTGKVFKSDKTKGIIQDIVTKFLRNFKYTPETSKQMCLRISSEIKSTVKTMAFPRYKIVCNVIIMQNKGQGSQISSRCVWDQETDSFASFTFTTAQIICIANVHAVYFE